MTSATTSFESACGLSIPDLLRILTDKLFLECTRLREHNPPPAIPTASLETEIESLETRAHDVLRVIPLLRNMLQPINKLPPEILSCTAQWFLHKSGATDARPVVPLTHVCRYWRRSIISNPANWTLISNDNEHLTALTLERAKAAHLQVSLKFEGDPPPFYVPAPYIQNVDSLRVTDVPSIEGLRQALPGFPQTTPNLRSLTLCNMETNWDLGSVDPFESLTPTLRFLALGIIPLYPSILSLRSLTELVYVNGSFSLGMDTLLEFLEENVSLERATLGIHFVNASLFDSRRQAPIKNNLRYLSIHFWCGRVGQALLSGISLQRGADLDIVSYMPAQLNDALDGVSPTHHLNLGSPTFMEYRSYNREIRLLGPSGTVSLREDATLTAGEPFEEFPLLPLSSVREFHLTHRKPNGTSGLNLQALVFNHAPFPALEAFAIDCATSLSHLLSSLFSNPSTLRSLKTLAFLNCDLDERFMKELARYASERKQTASASLHRVVIASSDGVFPSITPIRELRTLVPIVEVKVDTELPKDLA